MPNVCRGCHIPQRNSLGHKMPNVCRGCRIPPVKFTEAPDAQCLQGMPYSSAKFTGAPDAQYLQGMLYSPVKFTGAQDPQFLQGIRMPSPTNHPASWYAGATVNFTGEYGIPFKHFLINNLYTTCLLLKNLPQPI